jgi:ribulose 1,5-bisphosphate synthetase/thiazole synthase
MICHSVHEMSVMSAGTVVREAPRMTPVRDRVQVLVVGGGPAGVGAALAAAREGARTMLVERHGMLGGMWTAGLVNPFFEAERNGWIVSDLVNRLKARGAWRTWNFSHTFDPEVMKRELEAMMQEAGADFLYHTLFVDSIVEGGRVRGAIVESKAGREALLAEVVIDCTGDGDVAARAGVHHEFGRDADGLVQPMTLMFALQGDSDFAQTRSEDLYDAMSKALADSGLAYELPYARVSYTPWIISLPVPGQSVAQLTHVYRLNPLSPADLTLGTVQARRQAAEAEEILRRIPELAGFRLSQTAAHIGVRESRRIVGQYQLSLDDLSAGRCFDDAVATCSFGVDIHEPAPGAGVPSGHQATMRPYEIPYRCLLPVEVDGLLVAGRCISGTHEAHASYRVTGTCLATGQAAGLAAARAAQSGSSPSQVDGPALRQALAERGVQFLCT